MGEHETKNTPHFPTRPKSATFAPAARLPRDPRAFSPLNSVQSVQYPQKQGEISALQQAIPIDIAHPDMRLFMLVESAFAGETELLKQAD